MKNVDYLPSFTEMDLGKAVIAKSIDLKKVATVR